MAGLAVALALLVGISLGLLGGGGSILAVPMLVYVAGLPAQQAVATSLFVVGVTSLAGLVTHVRAGRVHWRTGLQFGVTGMLGSYLGGRLGSQLPGTVLLTAFALIMLAASIAMIRGGQRASRQRASGQDTGGQNTGGQRAGGSTGLRPVPTMALGVLVGSVTGLVGAGGGFLIVPALVIVAGLPMAAAVGTSLLVISLQSAAGLAGHLAGTDLPWGLTLAVTATAVAGSLLGARWCGRVDQATLRRSFGLMVLVMGAVVLAEQLSHQLPTHPAGWLLAAAVAATTVAATTVALLVRRREAGPVPTLPTPAATATLETVEPSMHFVQFYLDCLSQASYLIGDTGTGQAVVVDPRRDIAEYLAEAEQHGLRIVGVINTHFHADFLSGHLEMAAATGAWIGYGQAALTEFESRPLADGERIVLGDVELTILATPGHTPESISVLVFEHAADQVAYGVLTGDALFIGDVGRPDLLASIGTTADQLGKQLFHSIQHTLMGLPDAVRVFPAHGAGSACGKNLSTARQSTIGEQRLLNYACRPMAEDAFLALVTAGQPPAPEYFGYDAMLNRRNRSLYRRDQPVTALDPAQFEAAVARGAVLLDVRDPRDFAAGHLGGCVNVPADGRFAETVGMVLQPTDELIVIAAEDGPDEVAQRLARIGFDNVVGHLSEPEAFMLAHPHRVRRASRLTAAQLAAAANQPGPGAPLVLDVRNLGERDSGRIAGSMHIPLAELARRVDEIPEHRPVVAYCAGGWRSSVAASLLRRSGHPDTSDLLGGYAAWQSMHEPVTA
jgi:uncharacterized membrane protein YfcA/glyoxylase-like metal-dependent hydrolase (beta-lactamase superfamily II)/rhodanese-related sulfurtransferase